jgi:hypothetical protein
MSSVWSPYLSRGQRLTADILSTSHTLKPSSKTKTPCTSIARVTSAPSMRSHANSYPVQTSTPHSFKIFETTAQDTSSSR